MSEIRSIPLADILIDVENPRLPQPSVRQREAIRGVRRHHLDASRMAGDF